MKNASFFLIAVLVLGELAIAGEMKINKLQLDNVINLGSQSVRPNETANIAIPPLPEVPGKVIVLRFGAVTKSKGLGGCNWNASLEMNGVKVSRFTAAGAERLIGRNSTFTLEHTEPLYQNRAFSVFSGNVLMIMFAPDTATGNQGTTDGLGASFVMDISDIARGVDGNFLKINNKHRSSPLLVDDIEIGWINKDLLPKQKDEVSDRGVISNRITLENISLGQSKGGGFSIKIMDDVELLVETAVGMDNKAASSLVADDSIAPSGADVAYEKTGTIGYRSTASWPNVKMNRTIKIYNGLVYWSERWTNTTHDKIGVPFRHRLFLKDQAARFFLSGNSDISFLESVSSNPTAFLESPVRSGCGAGITAESDWLRLLVCMRTSGGVGEIYTETLALAAGASIDFKFTITPVRDKGGYWTFINDIRDRWGVNSYCMDRPFFWGYTRASGYSSEEETVQKSLGHLGPIYLPSRRWQRLEPDFRTVISGNYPKLPADSIPTPGKCPDFDVNEFLTFRHRQADWERQARTIETIRRVCPQIKMIEMTHPAMETVYKPLYHKWPWAADVVQTKEGLPFESATYSRIWLGDYVDKDWGILYFSPRPSSKYQSYVLNEMRKSLDECGFDGIYSDEFTWAGRRQGYSRYDYGYWDGYSADLDQEGNIIHLKADNAYVTAEYQWKLVHEVISRGKFFFCNGTVSLRSLNNLQILNFGEGGNGPGTYSRNHLSSVPLILGNTGDTKTRKGIFETVKSVLGRGCIYSPESSVNLLVEGSDNFVCKLYPITIQRIGPGCVKGKERLITTVSGDYNWPGYSTVVRIYEYNAEGNLNAQNKLVSLKAGQRLELQVPSDGLLIAEIAE